MTFNIKYAIVVNGPRGIEYIDNKEIYVKNQFNELGAKISLEKYLQRKYGNQFVRLEIKSCEEDVVSKFYNMFYGLRNRH
jgi:hypothetical protein